MNPRPKAATTAGPNKPTLIASWNLKFITIVIRQCRFTTRSSSGEIMHFLPKVCLCKATM
jgi:hypothetical protein